MTEKPLEAVVGEMLRTQGLKLGLAESSTGGLVGHLITEVSGSSDYFVGSIVAYSGEMLKKLLGVSSATLERYGVVSEGAAREMARGARRELGADIALAITGIASPHSGRSKKPVGLTYLCLSAQDFEICKRHVFGGDRSENKNQSAEAALDLLKRYLEGRIERKEK